MVGDSVEGNMTTTVTKLSKERGSPILLFQILFYPITNTGVDVVSYEKYQEKYFLGYEFMKWFWNDYLSNDINKKEHSISLLQVSLERLQGLPEALIIVGENVVLRADVEVFAHKLHGT